VKRPIEVTDVRLRTPSATDRARGVAVFASVVVDGRWEFDGLSVRRAPDGDHLLTFPRRSDSKRRERPFVRPLDEVTRRAVETAVLAELLRRQGESFAANQGATSDVAGARTRQIPRGGGGT
jgi:DNA-binding cell septation regulator SpoVG